MTTSKKTRPISKMHNKRSRIVIDIKDDSPEATREITASSPDTNSQSSLGGVAVEEEAKRVPLKIDPRTISHLSSEQREAIRQLHPQMNEYFYLNQRDKRKYFHDLNQKFRKEIRLPQPPGSAPMRKTIRFKKRFEILPFSHEDKSGAVRDRKSFMEIYIAKDDSKPKQLSRLGHSDRLIFGGNQAEE